MKRTMAATNVPDTDQDRVAESADVLHQWAPFLAMLALVVSDTFDWKDTVVFAPAAALVTAVTPGGVNIGDAEIPSIHSATGEKCDEFGNEPLAWAVNVPMAPPAGWGDAEALCAAGGCARAPVRRWALRRCRRSC